MKRNLLGAALAALVVTGVPGAGASTKTDLNEFPAEQRQLTESEKANRLFDDIFDRRVSRDPEFQTYLGIKTDYDKWTPLTEERYATELEHARADLSSLQRIDLTRLDDTTRLSYRLMEQDLERRIEDYRWRHHR